MQLTTWNQAVRNDDLTAGGHGPEAVQLGTGEVLQCVLAAARIQGVAVGQERQTALLLAQVGHHLGVVGAAGMPDCPAHRNAS